MPDREVGRAGWGGKSAGGKSAGARANETSERSRAKGCETSETSEKSRESCELEIESEGERA